jgi:hypothetical protein
MSSPPIVCSLWYTPFVHSPFSFSQPNELISPLFSQRQRRKNTKKLLDQHKSLNECEYRDLYEESPWRLYALQDDVLQKGNSSMEEDCCKGTFTCTFFTRSVVTIWLTSFRMWRGNGIKRIKLRRVWCRARMACKDLERTIRRSGRLTCRTFCPLIASRQHQNRPPPLDHRSKIPANRPSLSTFTSTPFPYLLPSPISTFKQQ